MASAGTRRLAAALLDEPVVEGGVERGVLALERREQPLLLVLEVLADQELEPLGEDRLARRVRRGPAQVREALLEDVLVDEPIGMLRSAWTAWDDEMRRIEGRDVRLPSGQGDADDVAEALAVHTDLAALMPQLVVSRLSENVR